MIGVRVGSDEIVDIFAAAFQYAVNIRKIDVFTKIISISTGVPGVDKHGGVFVQLNENGIALTDVDKVYFDASVHIDVFQPAGGDGTVIDRPVIGIVVPYKIADIDNAVADEQEQRDERDNHEDSDGRRFPCLQAFSFLRFGRAFLLRFFCRHITIIINGADKINPLLTISIV